MKGGARRAAVRRIGAAGLALVKRFEGFSPTVYLCPGGWRTVGYGHAIRPGERFPEPMSRETAEALLRRDLAAAERAVSRLIRVPLTQGQFDALTSFTFNLGAGALQRSTLRQKANREEHEAAAAEFLRWVHAGGRVLPGLVRRRRAEAALYRAAEG